MPMAANHHTGNDARLYPRGASRIEAAPPQHQSRWSGAHRADADGAVPNPRAAPADDREIRSTAPTGTATTNPAMNPASRGWKKVLHGAVPYPLHGIVPFFRIICRSNPRAASVC